MTSNRAWSSVWATSSLRTADSRELASSDIFDRKRSQVRERRQFGRVLGRELRGPASPDLQDANDFVPGKQRDGESGLHTLGAGEIEEITAYNFAPDVVFDRARLATGEDAPRHALPRAHSQTPCLGRQIADAPLHNEPFVLLQQDAADVGAEANLGLVRDLGEDFVEIDAVQDPVRDALKDLDRLELIGIAVPAL